MKHTVLCVLCLCIFITARGQQNSSQGKRQYVVVPPEVAALTVASQPDSPLKFEEARLLYGLDSSRAKSFRLRNRGTKPIRSFTIACVGVSEWSWQANNPKDFLMPGQVESGWSGVDYDILPLTEELKDKLKLRGSMQGVLVLMVVRIEYADGSTYSDEATYKALDDYLQRVEARPQPN